ncbi:hypothetical protein FB451DRAFT_1471029 [Mycena latifolia]|nr:hypothetical protein FB451DRAFT_1471029 [Mycena latifolia]
MFDGCSPLYGNTNEYGSSPDPVFPFPNLSEPVSRDKLDSPQLPPATDPSPSKSPLDIQDENEVNDDIQTIALRVRAEIARFEEALQTHATVLRAKEIKRLEEAFEVRGLRPFSTIRLQRVLALARFHHSIFDHDAALRITEIAMNETCTDYSSATDLEVPGVLEFDQARYDAQQETGAEFFALHELNSELRVLCAQQRAEERPRERPA